MPHRFAFRGERLAFSAGHRGARGAVDLVLAAFGGRVEALIRCTRSASSRRSRFAGGHGPPLVARSRRGLASKRGSMESVRRDGIVTLIFAVAKFALGAWLIVIVIPSWSQRWSRLSPIRGRGHREVRTRGLVSGHRTGPACHRADRRCVARCVQALTFARTMSDDVTAVHVTDDAERGKGLRARFRRQIPACPWSSSSHRTGSGPAARPLPRGRRHFGRRRRRIVLLPEYLPRNRIEQLLYNDNARRIRKALLGRPNVLVAEVPYCRGHDNSVCVEKWFSDSQRR